MRQKIRSKKLGCSIIAACCYFINLSILHAADIANWPSFSFAAVEILSYSGQKAVLLDKRNNPYRMNLSTKEVSKLAGRFKILRTDGNGYAWVLSRYGNIYFWSDPIWKKIKTGIKADNFSVTEENIICLVKGKIFVFSILL